MVTRLIDNWPACSRQLACRENLSNNQVLNEQQVISRIIKQTMASDISGVTSKEIELKRLQAELALEEQVTRLAQKRLAVRVLEAEIHSTSNRSVRSYASMTSPVIQSPPLKIHKSKGGDGPPEGDPNGDDEGPEDDSCPTTEYKPSPSPSPSAPIVEEASTTTSRIELPIDNNELRRLQLFR